MAERVRDGDGEQESSGELDGHRPGAAARSATWAPVRRPRPFSFVTLAAATEEAQDMADTAVTWLGHAAFRIDTPGGKRVYIDPWLGNPKCPESEQSSRSAST